MFIVDIFDFFVFSTRSGHRFLQWETEKSLLTETALRSYHTIFSWFIGLPPPFWTPNFIKSVLVRQQIGPQTVRAR